jgi:hypothetical protein
MIILALAILLLILRCLYWNITSPSAHWYDDKEPDDIQAGFQSGEQVIWYPDEYLFVNPPGERIRISNTAYPKFTYAMDGIVHVPNSYV